jgi:hypothetical protein
VAVKVLSGCQIAEPMVADGVPHSRSGPGNCVFFYFHKDPDGGNVQEWVIYSIHE